MVAEVTEAVMVDMEMKTRTPKAPLGAVRRPVSISPTTPAVLYIKPNLLRFLNMNSDVSIQGKYTN